MKVTVKENTPIKSSRVFPCWRVGVVSGDIYLMLGPNEGVQVSARACKLIKHDASSIDFDSMTRPFYGSLTVEV